MTPKGPDTYNALSPPIITEMLATEGVYNPQHLSQDEVKNLFTLSSELPLFLWIGTRLQQLSGHFHMLPLKKCSHTKNGVVVL